MRVELLARIGEKVRSLRDERGWTQAQTAERLGEVLQELEPHRADVYWTRPMAISRLERGTLAVPLELIEVLARTFDVDPLVIVEPAFSRAPRAAEVIEAERRQEFTQRLDRVYEQRLMSGPGRDALKLLIELVLTWPAEEIDAFGRTLNRLVVGRRAEELFPVESTAEWAERLRRLLDQQWRVSKLVDEILAT